MLKKTLYLLAWLLPAWAAGQKLEIYPTIEPPFFTADEPITITYDVSGTYMNDWTEAWIWMWLPDQNADVPSNVNPASSDPAATDPARFTKVTENGRQLFRITLTLTDFTNTPASQITKVGMLIKGNDWPDGQSVDYIAEVNTSFRVKFLQPQNRYDFYNSAQNIAVSVATSAAANLDLYIDNSLIKSLTGVTSFDTTHVLLDDGQVHKLMAVAATGSETDTAFYSYVVNPVTPQAPPPPGVEAGINYLADSVSATLVLIAPNKQNVFVIGDFNNWTLDNAYMMQQQADTFWLTITNLQPKKEYIFQYLVDGQIRIADPYSEKISSQFDDGQIISEGRYPGLRPYPSDLTSKAAGFLQTSRPSYQWQAVNYQRPPQDRLVIYELLVRDFTDARTYNAVTEKLDYLDSLGVNAIHIMPVMEFEGNISWGYNPAFMLAPDKYYGTENDLKRLIDEAHKRNIAVVLDIVLNHQFGRNSLVRLDNDDIYGPPTVTNPWFNRVPKHDFNVGYDMNHESQYTKDYVDKVVKYWLQEYHIDGYRFDLSKGFTQKNTLGNLSAWAAYDASRIAILKRIADVIWSVDSTAYVILEHFADNSEEKVLADYGMMLWGNLNGEYRALGKGFNRDLSWLYYGTRGMSKPGVLGYMESHDEERVMWDIRQSSKYPLKHSLNRIKLNAAFFFTVPGPKMIWQFGEFGYDVELNDDRLAIKPTKWEYLNDPERKRLFDVFASLIKLKTRTGIFDEGTFTWDPAPDWKWINVQKGDTTLCVVGNFSLDLQTGDPHLPFAGTWYEFFTGDTLVVDDNNGFEITMMGGEFRIYTNVPLDNYVDEPPTDLITGLDNPLPARQVAVYPNPTSGTLQIVADQPVQQVVIKDILGRAVITLEPHRREQVLSLAGLPGGWYVVEITTGNQIYRKRIIKQ